MLNRAANIIASVSGAGEDRFWSALTRPTKKETAHDNPSKCSPLALETTTATASAFRIGETDFWAALIHPAEKEPDDDNAYTCSPYSLHFVVDNSISMGGATREVQNVFSTLVDSAAARPCSFTLFSNSAQVLSDRIETTKQMLDLQLPPQGCTNIPAGVKKAVEIIAKVEQDEVSKGLLRNKTHHVLILLSDGHHNSGLGPSSEFPKIGMEIKQRFPDVQLSIVVVGVTKNSSK